MFPSGMIGLMLAALVAGFSVPTQAGINSQLGKLLGSPFLASLVSFCVGLLTVLVVVLVNQTGWPTSERLTTIPWWAWVGGMFGALFVTATILLAPRLGATTMLGLMLTGQMMASLFFDHNGYMGFPQHPLTLMRAVGVALVLAGVFFIQHF